LSKSFKKSQILVLSSMIVKNDTSHNLRLTTPWLVELLVSGQCQYCDKYQDFWHPNYGQTLGRRDVLSYKLTPVLTWLDWAIHGKKVFGYLVKNHFLSG
jgi:hypothetical protein